MTFPRTAQTIGVELFLDGAWQDITADVDRSGVQITRGRPDEAGDIDPGTCRFLLTGAGGRYSPRKLPRNTPTRVWVKAGTPRLALGSIADYMGINDNATISITGDIDLRVDLDPTTWRPATTAWLGLLKSGSYGLWLNPDGRLVVELNGGTLNHYSTVPLPFQVGRHAVRVSVDADNGSGGHTTTFYTAATMAGPWTQLGAPVVTTGTLTITDTTGALVTYVSTSLGPVSLYGFEVRGGLGAGTVATAVDFTALPEGTVSFTDAQGNAWGRAGAAVVTAKHYRFYGEISRRPQRWGPKGERSLVVPVEASGVKRRLLQGASPVRSALYRGCSTITNLRGYWPCEDGPSADRIAGYATSPPTDPEGTPTFADYDGFVASDPILRIGSSRCSFRPTPMPPANGVNQIRFAAMVPAATPNNAVLLRVHTTGTLDYYDLIYGTGGSLRLDGYADGVLVLTTGAISFGIDNTPHRVSLELAQDGVNVDATVGVLRVGATTGFTGSATSSAACTLGAPTLIQVNPGRAALGEMAFGHLTVETAITSLFDLAAQLNAWRFEHALDRAARVGAENGLSVYPIGGGIASQRMGYQRTETLLALLAECEATDGGVLVEPRSATGLVLRSLESMCRQDPGLTLVHTDNLLRPFEPVEDDLPVRNQVSVTRDGAGQSTVTETTGPLGTATIGVYDTSETLSLAADFDARQQAAWRVNLGTVDEPRWPVIGCHLHDSWWTTRGNLVRDLLTLDVGDRLVVENLPTWLPPLPADLIVWGFTETITTEPGDVLRFGRHTIELNCGPAAPYATLGLDLGDRWTNHTSTLNAACTASQTSLTVAWTAPPRWSAADGPFDVLVDDEVMTVTGITGTTSPQTFTVTRGTRPEAHASGAAVDLYRPARWAL